MKSMKTFFASTLAGSIALVGGGLAAVSAQESTPAPSDVSPVVGIHSGSCTDFTTEPAYDLGEMERITVQGIFESEDGIAETVVDFDPYLAYDDGWFDDEDDGYLYDDVDDDGIFDIGFDDNDDGILDDEEVLGEDLDGDTVLAAHELWSPLPVQTVWKADTDDLGFDGTELIVEGPYAMVVHASPGNYDQILACGPVLDLVEEDFVIVPLQSYSNSGYFGTGMIQGDEGEAAVYLFSDISSQGQSGANSTAAGAMDVTAIVGDDNIFTDADDGYLSDDLDDDGIFEIGFDENGDGVLDDNEVLGEDDNDDGELAEDEMDIV